MAKTIIIFKALTHEGKIVKKNITFEHNFEVIPSCKWNGIDLPPTSIEEQVMQMLDETDKSQIMIDNDFYLIIDYWPKKPSKKKSDEIQEFLNFAKPIVDTQPSFKRPFEAIVYESRDTLFGRGKSNATKFKEVLKMYELIMKGATGTLDMVVKLLDGKIEKLELE